jgi:asparagine synthase (glutamine-hydrolysing)
MTGLAGYVCSTKIEKNNLINNMIKIIKSLNEERINKWSNGFLTISRAHHGIINPESQPIYNEDKTLFIFMEGEIFDYQKSKLKLIKKGHIFKFKNNDAEYCLHLFEELGKDAFIELNGSFLLIIYDLFNNKLLIVNDRFASHPIYYYFSENGLLFFSTMLSSLIQAPEIPREIDIRSVFEFFNFQRILGKKTYYKNVYFIQQ